MTLQTYAIISGTEVVNIIEYDEQPTQPIPGLDPSFTAVLANGAGPGWTYANGVFTAPAITAPSLGATE